MEQLNLQSIIPSKSTSKAIVKSINNSPTNSYNSFFTHERALEDILPGFLHDSKAKSRLQKSRKILGEIAKDQSDDQIQTFCTQIQYMIDTWLDSYEQEIFEGSTLKQILGKG
jgi:hypothetical protein